MFEVPGIGADDVAWIERDQFVYFTEVERSLSDPSDWPRFKHDLARALTTALALPAIQSDDDTRSSGVPAPVSALLDRVRRLHDPAVEWELFQNRLWQERRSFGDPTRPRMT